MERLSFNSAQPYLAIEAAVHIARYAMARPVCRDRRVLDIACGEGYGSYAMATRWGAASVTGVDISFEAISSAQENFPSKNIEFHVGTAYDLSKISPDGGFDLIVCLETIEHLDRPELFLKELLRVAAPNATFIISCPNDPRHYGSSETGNPFHMRTYSAEQFFSTVDKILGPCTRKFIGTPVAGFGNFEISTDTLKVGESQRAMVDANLAPTLPALLVPPDDLLELDNSSYYVGVWAPGGSYPEQENATVYPCDMHSAAQNRLRDEVIALRSKIAELNREANETSIISDLRQQLRRQDLTVHALKAELSLAREAVRLGNVHKIGPEAASGSLASNKTTSNISDILELIEEFHILNIVRMNNLHSDISRIEKHLETLNQACAEHQSLLSSISNDVLYIRSPKYRKYIRELIKRWIPGGKN